MDKQKKKNYIAIPLQNLTFIYDPSKRKRYDGVKEVNNDLISSSNIS